MRADEEDFERLGGEQFPLQGRGQQPEEGRPQQHAGNHLPHYLRLADALGRQPHQAADRQDDEHLEEEDYGELRSGHGIETNYYVCV